MTTWDDLLVVNRSRSAALFALAVAIGVAACGHPAVPMGAIDGDIVPGHVIS